MKISAAVKIGVALVAMSCLSVTSAQTSEAALIKQSQLALSAFQCGIVATDKKDQERLFKLGVENGRSFIDTMKARPDLHEKIHMKIAMLWGFVGGPSTDFVLGQIYSQLESDIYKKYDSDARIWTLTKENMYREKNCSLL